MFFPIISKEERYAMLKKYIAVNGEFVKGFVVTEMSSGISLLTPELNIPKGPINGTNFRSFGNNNHAERIRFRLIKGR